MRKKIIYDTMRRLILVLLLTAFAFSLCVPFVSAAQAMGTCGNGLNWTLSVDGTLIISGKGEMQNYSKNNPAPWYQWKDQIRILFIEDGVTSVGSYAFYEMENITHATIASSVKKLDNCAFEYCKSLKSITLGTGMEYIGKSAFANCESLKVIRFPNSLKSIGEKSFYRCYNLQSIMIPASVTFIGDMAFTYCNELVSAEIRASISELPYWMFYGCDALSTISLAANITSVGKKALYRCDQIHIINYAGSQEDGEKIIEDIRATSVENVQDYSLNLTEEPITSGSSVKSEYTEDVIYSNTVTVTTTGNSTLSTTVSEAMKYQQKDDGLVISDIETSVKIEAVIENEAGWNELLDEIHEGEKQNLDNEKINIDVSLNDTKEISGETLNALAGKDINLTIDMKDGSTVKIDCERLEKVDEEKTMEVTALSYTISSNDNPTKTQIKTIGDSKSFLLSFKGSSEFDFSPQIYIGKEYAYQTATLYQYIPGRGLSLLQTVMVDKSGQATYYLQSTKDTTQYLIALNVKDIDASTAIIPEDIAADYGDMMYYEKIEYVTTGVRMFMGLSLFQFGIAVFCVMLFLFVAVGIVMGILYRKKKLELYYQRLREQNG